jgi:CHAD domain-containing protein
MPVGSAAAAHSLPTSAGVPLDDSERADGPAPVASAPQATVDTVDTVDQVTSHDPVDAPPESITDARAAETQSQADGAKPAGLEPARPARHKPRPFRPEDSMVALVYHNLDRHFDAMQRELPRVISLVDADGVHQLRAASRRIRSTLKAFGDLLPRPQAERLSTELAWFAKVLGQVRDLDVHRASLDGRLSVLPSQTATDLEPYLRDLANGYSAARQALLEQVSGERSQRLMAAFASFLDRGPSQVALRRSAGQRARQNAVGYVEQALRRVRKVGRHLERDSPPERLHELRLRCKKFRYVLESFEPVFGDRLRTAVKAARRLQDSLGDIQDASVAAHHVQTYLDSMEPSQSSAACRLALAELMRLHGRDAADAQKRFRRAWKRFDTKVRKRKLRRLMH